MARLNPFIERKIGTEEGNLGKILLFCEGYTEQNYFNYFANIINSDKHKYSHIEIVPLNAHGNAQRVLNFANDFLEDDGNAKKFILYEKYLVFDCDAPENIQQVIIDMQKQGVYILLLSNFLFETWLLMHFENVNSSLTKSKTYSRLASALGIDYYGDNEKASEGTIRQIIGNGDNLRMAIGNAKELESLYESRNLLIEKDINKMNPYSTVYKLLEQILIEMSRVER